MAAMSYARPFFSFVDIVCGPLGLGMQLVSSNYIGKGDVKRAQKTFSGALFIGLIISAIFVLLGLLIPDNVASSYAVKKGMAEILPLSSKYLDGLFIGIPAMIGFGILSPIVQLGGGKKLITYSIVVQLIADIIGDSLSVFVFKNGIFGIGLATSLSYYFSLIPLFVYFCRKDAILRLRLSAMPFADIKEIVKAGATKAIKRICNTIKPIVMNLLSVILGTSLALSAFNITNQMRDLLISFSAGVAGAVILIGALLYSQRDRTSLKALTEFTLWSIVFIAVIGAICIIFSRQIVGIFISDSEEVIEMAALSIRCIGFMIPFATFNGVFISFQQMTGRYKTANKLSYLNRLILIVFFSAVLGFVFGTNGLWWAFPVSEIANTIMCLLIVRRRLGRFPREILDLLCLPEDFGLSENDYIEFNITDKKDIENIFEKVKEFCQFHKIDSQKITYTELALEELSINVIEHGFPKCKKNPIINIWISYDGSDIFLRFQDNCPSFNVMKYCSEIREKNPESSIGLHIISKISKEMYYFNSLNTNNLTITI